MSVNDEQLVEDGIFEEVASPAMAVIPLAPPPHGVRSFVNPRPDPSFVAQLIATAEQLPQTRYLRRAAPADAMSAYRAGQRSTVGTGLRTRHVA
jgi:hypothetical protein